MEMLFTESTLAAILFLCAALVQSFCFMNNRLPEERRSPVYPAEPAKKVLLNLSWMFQLGCAVVMSMQHGGTFLAVALAIYFIILPFVFQPPMAKMLGFRNLRDYIETVDAQKK